MFFLSFFFGYNFMFFLNLVGFKIEVLIDEVVLAQLLEHPLLKTQVMGSSHHGSMCEILLSF